MAREKSENPWHIQRIDNLLVRAMDAIEAGKGRLGKKLMKKRFNLTVQMMRFSFKKYPELNPALSSKECKRQRRLLKEKEARGTRKASSKASTGQKG